MGLYQLLGYFDGDNRQAYVILKRVFSEQFDITGGGGVELKAKKELKATNVQSPEDPDADYRKKGDTTIYGGYSANATETCNEDGSLNLITAPEVEPASAADNNFYQSGIEKTQEITGSKVEKSFTDGAYNSQENQQYNQTNEIDHVLTGLQGEKGRYSFEETQTKGNIIVIDNQAQEKYQASLTKNGNSYKFTDKEGKQKYLTTQQIESYFHRQQIESRDWNEKKTRNNVEATIFQLFYFTRNNKLRYRGLKKIRIWIFLRSLWVNCVRIKNYLVELASRIEKSGQKNTFFEKNAGKFNFQFESLAIFIRFLLFYLNMRLLEKKKRQILISG